MMPSMVAPYKVREMQSMRLVTHPQEVPRMQTHSGGWVMLPKPRLSRYGGRWLCSSGDLRTNRVFPTMQQAYEAWVLAVCGGAT
jgi:nitrate reductase beta subunit